MSAGAPGTNLRRDRIIAWITVIFSVVALIATRPKNPAILGLLFLALLGGLVWIVVIGFQLRKVDMAPTFQETAFWRVVFLWIFAVLIMVVCYYDGLNNWQNWLASIMIGVLSAASAILLWKRSPKAKYPLYAITLYIGVGSLGGSLYNYLHYPALLLQPIKQQIMGWLIPGVPTALLINCCLFARRTQKVDPSPVAQP